MHVICIGAATTMWPFVGGEKATSAAILKPVRMGTHYKHLDTLAAYRQKQSVPSAGRIMAVLLQEKKQQQSTGVGKQVTEESHKKEMAAILGMGTACYPFSGGKHAKLAVLNAIKLGYRHFDTAVLYQTEQPIGEAISEALRLGIIKSRAELFIVSKLWCADAHPGLVIPALQNTLRNLQLDYLDAYLIHWPVSMTPGKYILPLKCKVDLVPMDYESVWAEMEVCQKLGLTKSIGVSNFSRKKLETILATAKIPPAVNLTEVNPHWQQKTLLEFCKAKGIAVRASSPLGGKGTLWGSDRIMECEVIRKIAKAKGKTHAQICLRWAYEQGVSLLVKSFNDQRMKENTDIFDWELNADELKLISEIPQRRGLPGHIFVSPTGPFKTEQELWDE